MKENESFSAKPIKEDLLYILDQMIQRIDELPPQARYAPINHADFASALRVVADILRAC